MVHQTTEYYAAHAHRGPSFVQKTMTTLGRLVLPVLALLVVMFLADGTSDQTVAWFDAYFRVDQDHLKPGYWMTLGHLLIPLMFWVINLTNRRYGASYATAQVMIVWAILGGFVYWFFVRSPEPMSVQGLPPVRTCTAFVVAMVLSQFMAISVFDWTRGNPWWRAPIYGALYGAATFCLVFYAGAYWKTGLPWVNQMVTHFGFMALISFLLMAPYYLLRPMIKPLPGYGGA